MPRLMNDGSKDPPKLRVYLNADNLTSLPEDSIWPGLEGPERDRRLLEDGFEGLQLTDQAASASTGLPYCGLDRINTPEEAWEIAARHADRGDLCLTVHAGWGVEGDTEVARLVEAILQASESCRIPIFLETHRATITQDVWRTVQITRRFPEVTFNGDFSHYYCGQELVYGDWQSKLEFMEPIFERTAFLHGRIASPGCMQVPIGPHLDRKPDHAHGVVDYLAHFRELWVRAMTGFLRRATLGDVLIFAPELLPGTHYYARLFPNEAGHMVEESDRYQQALLYRQLARLCFQQSQVALACDTV